MISNSSIADILAKNVKDSILEKYPDRESLEKYIKENKDIPVEVVTLIDSVQLQDIKNWLYGPKKLKVVEPSLNEDKVIAIMTTLDEEAEMYSTDPKVFVGACVGTVTKGTFISMGGGVNANNDYNEREIGETYRERLFGSRDKKYRPWDKIIHAEENAIINALNKGNDNKYSTAIVTRYPCEKCAQLLIYKGIKEVYYGRPFPITKETEQLFADNDVVVHHIKNYEGQKNDDNK